VADDVDRKRGPKGGVKHKPGRGHDRKSQPPLKKRFQKKAAAKQQQKQDELRKQWEVWDRLPPEVRKLRKDLTPKDPRPSDAN
jgi:hypothetical protein